MPYLRRFLAAALGLMSIDAAHAQTVTSCPPGMVAYGAGVCGYDHGPDSAAHPQASNLNSPGKPSLPRGWTAIVRDRAKPIVVQVAGMKSRRDAVENAMAQCQAKGGSECELDIALEI